MRNKIPWLRVLTEGLVIVVSILLAFGIDAWWDGRLDRVRERGYLEALLSEFEAARAEAIRDQDRAQTRLSASVSLLAQPSSSYQAPPDSVRTWLAWLSGTSTYYPPNAVYSDLISSGGIGLISSDELRVRLLDYGARAERLKDLQARELKAWEDGMRGYLIAESDMLHQLFNADAEALPFAQGSPAFDRLLSQRPFRNLIVERWRRLRTVVSSGGTLIEVVDSIIDLIKGELDHD